MTRENDKERKHIRRRQMRTQEKEIFKPVKSREKKHKQLQQRVQSEVLRQDN